MDRRLIFQWRESFLGRVFKKIRGVIGVPPCPIGNPISPCKKSRCQLNLIIGKWTVLEVQNQAKQAFLVIRKKNVKKKKKKRKKKAHLPQSSDLPKGESNPFSNQWYTT